MVANDTRAAQGNFLTELFYLVCALVKMLKVCIYAQSYLQHLGCGNCLNKLALLFLHNFHREHSCVKLETKKLSLKINVKNIKKLRLIILLLILKKRRKKILVIFRIFKTKQTKHI